MSVDAEWPLELPADYAIVGEAPGETELIVGRPFVGPSGRLLDAALARAGILRRRCLVTNVFQIPLPQPKPRTATDGPFAAWLRLPYNPGAYLPPELVPATLVRLKDELTRASPQRILALGQTAIWAMLGPEIGRTRISRVVGNWYTCSLVPGIPCLPCYHPAAVLRQPALRVHFFRTIQKLKAGPDAAAPDLNVSVPSGPADVADWAQALSPETLLAVDIELYRRQIECVGFCDGERALVVPFLNGSAPWWDSPETEAAMIRATATILQHPCPKVLQNGQFDVAWLWNAWGVGIRNWCHDTRLMHHVWMPDIAKDLAAQAAIHLNTEGWKHLGSEEKRDA